MQTERIESITHLLKEWEQSKYSSITKSAAVNKVRTKYEKQRMEQVFNNELSKICGRQPFKNLKCYVLPNQIIDHIISNLLKAVLNKFYLVCSWILCPKYYNHWDQTNKINEANHRYLASSQLLIFHPLFKRCCKHWQWKSSNFLLLSVMPTIYMYICTVFKFKESKKFSVQAAKIMQRKDLAKGSNFAQDDQLPPTFYIINFLWYTPKLEIRGSTGLELVPNWCF